MFVLIEKESFKDDNGKIIEVELTVWPKVHETIEQAIESNNNRMGQLSKCHDDYVKISDTKCKYTYVNMESYSEFLIAKIEIVPSEENLDVSGDRIQRAVKVLKEAERYTVNSGNKNFVEWHKNPEGYAIETRHVDAALSILEGNDDLE